MIGGLSEIMKIKSHELMILNYFLAPTGALEEAMSVCRSPPLFVCVILFSYAPPPKRYRSPPLTLDRGPQERAKRDRLKQEP